MRKRIIALGIILMSFICLVGLVGCKKTDTYKGNISTTSYTSEKAAVRGFVEEELSSNIISAELVNYTVKKELSDKEIGKLAISEEDSEGLLSVKQIEVEFKEVFDENELNLMSMSNGQRLESTEKNETKSVNLYLLVYKNTYRFFSPTLKKGDLVTKSYFDSIFDPENFKNATMTMEYKTTTTTTEYKGTSNKKVKVKMKTANGNHYYYSYAYYSEADESDESYDESYTFQYNGYAYDISKHDYSYEKSDWEIEPGVNVEEKEEIIQYEYTLVYKQLDLDYNCFQKTLDGCALRDDLLKKHFFQYDDIEFSYYNIKVSNGKVAEVKFKFTITGNWGTETMIADCKYSDYGKTSVTFPADVQAKIDDFKKSN